jgi:hypothetical protein
MGYEESKSYLKVCVGFGIVNLLLAFLLTNFRVRFLSEGIIFLIIMGIAGSAKCIVDNWKEGFKLLALGCLVAFLLNCLACDIYIYHLFFLPFLP